MSPRQNIRLLPDGRRLHLQDGPIDLVIGADGSRQAVAVAYRAATARFATLLDELCAELPLLRRQVTQGSVVPKGTVARAMFRAAKVFATERFVTPMVAVAGAGADAILAAMTRSAVLSRAFVNNGGDIAIHLSRDASFTIGMIDRPDRTGLFGQITLDGNSAVHGIATSGRHGRSFSLGIADAVTVLAADAASADAAATMIANEVDLPGHPAIRRRPATDLQPDSDLGALPVTCALGPLTRAEIDLALGRGLRYAGLMVDAGIIHAAALHLAGRTRTVGAVHELPIARQRNRETGTHAAG